MYAQECGSTAKILTQRRKFVKKKGNTSRRMIKRRKSDANRQHRQCFCYAKRKIGSKTSKRSVFQTVCSEVFCIAATKLLKRAKQTRQNCKGAKATLTDNTDNVFATQAQNR